jgi:riboflavin synthase
MQPSALRVSRFYPRLEMPAIMLPKDQYLAELAARKETNKNRVSRKFQSTGLAIADLLEDRDHKALYIRLAKAHDEEKLMSLAKDIADNKRVKNRGAYFMQVLKQMKEDKKI